MKELRKFIGMVGFYHRFIPKLSNILAPLHDLVAKSQRNRKQYEWNEKHMASFEQVKLALSKLVALTIPRNDRPFTLSTDASDYAVGGCLEQNGRPIAYFSRKLTKCEQRYSTIDKELLAIYLSVKKIGSFHRRIHNYTSD